MQTMIADLRAAELRSPSGELEAAFYPRAGMIGWSLRHRGEELVAHPSSLEDYVQGGHATAIPLLHPWANRLDSPEYQVGGKRVRLDMNAPNVHTDPAGLPIHGLLAGSPHWQVLEEAPSGLIARLDFATRPELMAGFPFAHVLELAAELSDRRLAIATELRPTGEEAVPVAFGFHPYLRLPGVDREQWLLEMPVTSQMELDERMLPTGRSRPVRIETAPLGERTFDDAFDGLADPPEFAISAGGRRLAVRFEEGYRFAQVYAPARRDFICFEPMTAPGNPFATDRTLFAQPGSSYRARFEIEVGETAPR
jgi:aldose 1-epimerase